MNATIYDMPESEYRSAPGVSQSDLKAIARSPAHFKAGIECEENEATEAMLLGRLAGTLILEPKREPWWCVKPDGIAFNNTEGKQWLRDFLKWDEEKDGKFPRSSGDALAKKGITLISFKDFDIASQVARAVEEHPTASMILDGSKREVSCFAEVETDYGMVQVKCRHDIVSPGSNCIIDLKTTMIATPDAFLKSVIKFGYDIQMASYLDIWNMLVPEDQKETAIFVAVEKQKPFAIQIHQLDQGFIEHGREKYKTLLNTYARCVAENSWPAYPLDINVLTLPDRYRDRIDR